MTVTYFDGYRNQGTLAENAVFQNINMEQDPYDFDIELISKSKKIIKKKERKKKVIHISENAMDRANRYLSQKQNNEDDNDDNIKDDNDNIKDDFNSFLAESLSSNEDKEDKGKKTRTSLPLEIEMENTTTAYSSEVFSKEDIGQKKGTGVQQPFVRSNDEDTEENTMSRLRSEDKMKRQNLSINEEDNVHHDEQSYDNEIVDLPVDEKEIPKRMKRRSRNTITMDDDDDDASLDILQPYSRQTTSLESEFKNTMGKADLFLNLYKYVIICCSNLLILNFFVVHHPSRHSHVHRVQVHRP